MKYSYSWLKKLSKTKLSPQKVAELVSMRAFEFEEAHEVCGGFENIVVGKIESIKKHPNADRLQLTVVNIGNKKSNIVCGAPNIKTGDKVPVALPGAVLGDFTIKETEIRGAKSQGMLCSKKEMGLGNSHSGIFILDKAAKVGEKLADYLKLGDTQLEFAILPNRSHDALSHIGMAREICAIEGRKFSEISGELKLLSTNKRLKVDINDGKLCSRYIGVLVENIEIGPSPAWIQSRLEVCGLKPINNIVDITNFVMLETGQPLHAFDLNKIESEFPISPAKSGPRQGGGNFQFPNKPQNKNPKTKILVRRAKKGEEIKLLDENIYKLNESDLVIADSNKPIALAGVMGGYDSAISKGTNSIILESANFNSTNIRKTRTSHNIITESSHRFERNIDPNLAEMGAALSLELFKKYGGANVKISATQDTYPMKIKPWKIKLDPNYVNKLLGESIAVSRMKNILENLGLRVLGNRISKYSWKPNFQVEIPTRRIDLQTQEDLIEEVGRIYGYENIKEQAPSVKLSSPITNKNRIFEDKLRDVMTGLGFSEVMNYSFYGADDIEKCMIGMAGHFEVENPLSPEQRYLRRSLIPGILKNVRTNSKYFDKFSIFEIGRKYKDENKDLPVEKLVLAGALVNDPKKGTTFFELKGKIEELLNKLGNLNVEFGSPKPEKYWHPTRTAQILAGGKEVGKIGEVNPQVLGRYGIKRRISIFGVGVEKLHDLLSANRQFHSINVYPAVKRDISMFVPGNAQYKDIAENIKKSGGKMILGVELFDIFEKDGQKSMALRIEIGSREKTLTTHEIDEVMKRIIEKLEKDLNVKVRK